MVLRFGDFELDESLRELRRGGRAVEIEPKAFELLSYLARHRDRAVSKSELQNELWPRMIVTETALTRCVMKARRAVGDDSATQGVIRTLHGHGYRFLPEVEETAAAPAALDGETTGPARGLPPFGTRRWVQGIAVVLLVGAGVAWLALKEPAVVPNAGTLAVLPVDNRIADDELGWARLGLMSLIVRMLADSGVEVADERAVLRAVGDRDLAAAPDAGLLAALSEQAGAESVLAARLEVQGGLHRLSATLTAPDGRRVRRIIVGESPAAVAADLARVVAGLVAPRERDGPAAFRRVSSDPFVNEAYGRALDLELQGDYAEARELFRIAAVQEPGLFWLRYEIALCTRFLREWDDARAQFADLLEEARAGGDAEALVSTLNAIGVTDFLQDRYAEARPVFEEALAAAAAPEFGEERATIRINLGLIAMRLGDYERAREHYESAFAEYAAAGEEALPSLENNYAGLLMEFGEYEAALAHSRRAVEGFRVRGHRAAEAPATNRLAKLTRSLGDVDRAIELHERARLLYTELGNTLGVLSVELAMAEALREKGDLTRARLTIDSVIERVGREDDRLLAADARLARGRVAADLGNDEEAARWFREAREGYLLLGVDAGRRRADAGLVAAALAAGDLEFAGRLAEALLDEARAAAHPAAAAEARLLLADVATAAGRDDEAGALLAAVLEQARSANDRELLGEAGIREAERLLDGGDPGRAASLLEELRPIAGGTHRFLRSDARLAAATGDTERALAILNGLRSRAAERWRDADEALLAELAARTGGTGH